MEPQEVYLNELALLEPYQREIVQKSFHLLKDKWERLNSLYWIVNKKGQRVRFHCNESQTWLFENMWYRNLILKERRRGCTTFIDLYMLDECLFNSNVEAGIIAHRMDAAKKIFRRQVRYPYDNLEHEIKASRPLITDSKNELAFPNNSVIYVDTTIRSGTAQYLHLSEFGELCAQFPDKAREVVAGSIEAVHIGQMLWIESTAQGKEGYFYDYCKMAQDRAKEVHNSGKPLTKLDFRFFFIGWWEDPDNVLEDFYPCTEADQLYFQRVEAETGTTLSEGQKWWYAAKKATLKGEVKKQYPATPEEAFEAAIAGAIYSTELALLREQGRIGTVPHEPGYRVNTYWDLGWDDSMTIWFAQEVGNQIRVIDYYENVHEGLLHYAKIMDRKAVDGQWLYGQHFAPHDIEVHELGSGRSRLEQARHLRDVDGTIYSINFTPVPKIERETDGMEVVRTVLGRCWFNQSTTTRLLGDKEVGFPSLEGYRYEWDEKAGAYKNRPFHNWASHGAKALETLALAHAGKPKKWDKLDEAFG